MSSDDKSIADPQSNNSDKPSPSLSVTLSDPRIEARLLRKFDTRILPPLTFMFDVSYLLVDLASIICIDTGISAMR
jgi:hypothetical protein